MIKSYNPSRSTKKTNLEGKPNSITTSRKDSMEKFYFLQKTTYIPQRNEARDNEWMNVPEERIRRRINNLEQSGKP